MRDEELILTVSCISALAALVSERRVVLLPALLDNSHTA